MIGQVYSKQLHVSFFLIRRRVSQPLFAHRIDTSTTDYMDSVSWPSINRLRGISTVGNDWDCFVYSHFLFRGRDRSVVVQRELPDAYRSTPNLTPSISGSAWRMFALNNGSEQNLVDEILWTACGHDLVLKTKLNLRAESLPAFISDVIIFN